MSSRRQPLQISENFKLKLPEIRQLRSNWCWVACTRMLLLYYTGRNFSGKAIAASLIRASTSKSKYADGNLNVCCKWSDVDDILCYWGLKGTRTPKPLRPKAIVQEIRVGRPVLLGFTGPFRTGHLTIATGFSSRENGRKFVHVIDPHEGGIWLPYFGLKRSTIFGDLVFSWRTTPPDEKP